MAGEPAIRRGTLPASGAGERRGIERSRSEGMEVRQNRQEPQRWRSRIRHLDERGCQVAATGEMADTAITAAQMLLAGGLILVCGAVICMLLHDRIAVRILLRRDGMGAATLHGDRHGQRIAAEER